MQQAYTAGGACGRTGDARPVLYMQAQNLLLLRKRTSRLVGGLDLHFRWMWGEHRPEPDAGVRTAYVFSKPHGCEEMTAGAVRTTLLATLLASAASAHWYEVNIEGSWRRDVARLAGFALQHKAASARPHQHREWL